MLAIRGAMLFETTIDKIPRFNRFFLSWVQHALFAFDKLVTALFACYGMAVSQPLDFTPEIESFRLSPINFVGFVLPRN